MILLYFVLMEYPPSEYRLSWRSYDAGRGTVFQSQRPNGIKSPQRITEAQIVTFWENSEEQEETPPLKCIWTGNSHGTASKREWKCRSKLPH
jgi:hypothetical protein